MKVLLAKIVATKGLKGEVKIKTFTSNPLSLLSYKTFDDQNNTLLINEAYPHKNLLIAKIAGISTIEQAENLIGRSLYINREDLPQNDEEESYYHIDLKGLKVLNYNGVTVGNIENILNFGAEDILEIKENTTKQTFMIAFTKKFVPEVNIKDGYVKLGDINYIDEKITT